jgi:hypothetical protein
MGWHNKQEAGVDRRGINAAINALIARAQRALAELEEVTGNSSTAARLRCDAEAMACRVHEAFFDSAQQVYVDGIFEGKPLKQISEQTNTWCILAGCCERSTAVAILQKMLLSDVPTIARNGPYSWAYLFPLLSDLGLTEIGLEAARKLWTRMLDGGADTLWETFLGDDLDTWCHPWSGAPIEFCLTGVLGLPALHTSRERIELRPRYDLLERAGGRMHTQFGPLSLSWEQHPGGAQLTGTLPSGASATVFAPDGRPLGSVSGNWQLTVQR